MPFPLLKAAVLYIAVGGPGDYVECPLQSAMSRGWTATLALDELREEQGEDVVGGALLLWREDACELLGGSLDLYEETEMAIERECLHAMALPYTTEKDMIAAAKKAWFGERRPSLISLAWDTPTGGAFLISDNLYHLLVRHPGYGEPGEVEVDCGKRGFATNESVLEP